MMKRPSLFAIFLVLFALGTITSSSAASLPSWGSPGWFQFPSNDFSRIYDPGIAFTSSAQLALTAEGDEIAMSYTPASYELKKLPGSSTMELQIFDAPYSPQEGSHDIGPGMEALMELIFEGDGAWEVKCWSASDGEYKTVASPQQNRVQINAATCFFPSGAWSGTLFLNSGDAPLIMRTVWKDADEAFDFANKPASYQNLINVFRLQTRHGIAQLLKTSPEQIRTNDGEVLSWKSHEQKTDFERSLNWVVLYKTMQETFFSFEIDVRDISEDYLYLFDKDADAHRLFTSKGKTEAAKPPDEGIQMMVRWSDGSPLEYNEEQKILEGGIPITENPEWTRFDQTNREGFSTPWKIPGETGQFDGPSWDTDKDARGIDSIRWYQIPLIERKSDTIVVGWFGSNMPNNTFAFAASSSLSPAPCAQPDRCREEFEEQEEEVCDPDMNPDCPIIPDLPEECVRKGVLEACLTSIPKGHPAEESFGLDPLDESKNTISYRIDIENLSTGIAEALEIEDISLFFEPPARTTFLDPLPLVRSPDGGVYTGKGYGEWMMANSLPPGEHLIREFSVQLDVVPGMTDYDIDTEELFSLEAANNPRILLPGIRHHVGKGDELLQVHRCYAFDFFGGEFECSDLCQSVEPGTQITVRDTLMNVGSGTAREPEYFPPPLSSSFVYDSYSIRIDDPEFGLTVPNDGESFPGAEGIGIPGSIPSNGSREVFFRYFVPLDILTDEADEPGTQCFPDDEELSATPPEEPPNYTKLIFDQDCSSSNEISDPLGSICVTVEPDPMLEVTLTAIPSPGSTVYRGSGIQYFLSVTNRTLQPVQWLEIEATQPQQSWCVEGVCNGIEIVEPVELSRKFGSMSFHATIRVNDDAAAGKLIHPGIRLRFRGESGLDQEILSNPLEHVLLAQQESFGDFQHHISLGRRTVLNAAERDTPRPDQADRIEVNHSFSYSGSQTPSVWPDMYGSRNYRVNVCSAQYPSFEYYDAQWNSGTTLFNSAQRTLELSTFEQLRALDADFQITTKSPEERPELLVLDGLSEHQDQFNYRMNGMDKSTKGLQSFMAQGGEIHSEELPGTRLRAVKDGIGGKVETMNQVLTSAGEGVITRDLWVYSYSGSYYAPQRCTYCSRWSCWKYGTSINIYRWKLAQSDRLSLKATSSDYVSVLGSVAWLQTKNGNMGFGTPLWESTPKAGDPNWVALGNEWIPTLMKTYTPPGESNADLFITSPGLSDPLISALGANGRIHSGSFDEGFIPSSLLANERQLSRGNAYDRAENPRDYFDDLINRQIYGPVIRLNGASSLPTGMTRQGSEFFAQGMLVLEPDAIYFIKGKLNLGTGGGSDLILSGGKARLVVEGQAVIRGNIRYSTSDPSNLVNTPSVRLHTTGDISIYPSVTDVELMMLAEGSFHSGRSDHQLRILGDVIAFKSYWERSPLNQEWMTEDGVNNPSELIIEDFRKYLIPPPGDKKLPDPGWRWEETVPGNHRDKYGFIRGDEF